MLAAAGCAALLVVSCGSSASSSSGTTPAPTASQPGTPAASSTATATPPPAGTIPFVTFPPTSTDGGSPAGSGCTPASATVLPDGTWFGTVSGIDPAAGTLGLDLACLYYGDAANAAASADGVREIPVPNDYYIRNESSNVYILRAVPDVAVGRLADQGGSADAFEPTRSGLAAAVDLPGRPAVWVEVVDGWVVAIQQQYLP